MEKILLIDDSLLNISVLRQILQMDYEVYSAADGEKGLELAKSLRPSLILVDIIMPAMDGFEVLRRLKADSSTCDIPVICLTGLTDESSEEKGFSLGAVDYITKPFKPLIVKARVRTHVELSSYRRLMEKMAMIDGLTGLPNRRSYELKRSVELERQEEGQRAVSVILVDIDFFKQYNDNYGHLKGDEAICAVGGAIRKSVKKFGGFAARYGGEEFIILLTDADGSAGHQLAEDVRSSVEGLKLVHNYGSLGGKVLTISLGVANGTPSDEYTWNQLVETADAMLYRAKAEGRNRVICDREYLQ